MAVTKEEQQIVGTEALEAAEMLEKEVPENIKNDFEKEQAGRNENIEGLITNVNQKVLIDILSPEVIENEQAKRKHKKTLLVILTIFLVVQFLTTAVIMYAVVRYACSTTAKLEIVNSLLTFVTGYITSVVIELIAILKYIVKNVFDTSIAELVKIFKDNDK